MRLRSTPAKAHPTHACDGCPSATTDAPVLPDQSSEKGTRRPLFLVGGVPSADDLKEGSPFMSATGAEITSYAIKHWPGQVVRDLAIRCKSSADIEGKKRLKVIDHCRHFLAMTYRMAMPEKIFCFGADASEAVLGRRIDATRITRPYQHHALHTAYVFPSLNSVAGNELLLRKLKGDLKWAMQHEAEPQDQKPIVLVDTSAKAAEAINALGQGPYTYDTETYGELFTPLFTIVAFAITSAQSPAVFVWDEKMCAPGAAREMLLTLLHDGEIQGQNLKYDQLAVYSAWGFMPSNVAFDTRLVAKILDPENNGDLSSLSESIGMGGHKDEMADARANVEHLVKARLRYEDSERTRAEKLDRGEKVAKRPKGFEPPPELSAIEGMTPELEGFIRKDAEGAHGLGVWAKKNQWAYGLANREVLYRYNGLDTLVTHKLVEHLQARLNGEPGARLIWEKVAAPASTALAWIEAWGIAASSSRIKAYDAYLTAKIEHIDVALKEFADINWASTQQVTKYLFETIGLQSVKTTPKGAPSVDAASLEKMAGKHDAIDALLRLRKLEKLRGTYARGLLPYVIDGRVHPVFLQSGARSGRISCTSPSLQTIPRRDDQDAKGARDCFTAPFGKSLVSLDFSQLELRVSAMLSGDEVMRDRFVSGADFHLETAKSLSKLIWGIEPDQVEKKHRSDVKAVVFGVLYGKHATSFAEQFGVPQTEAVRIVDQILGAFPKLRSWIASQREQAGNTGVVFTEWDGQRARSRPVYDARSPDKKAAAHALNAAVNSSVQGTASDLCLASIAKIVPWIHRTKYPAKLVLTVHDSVIFEVQSGAERELIDVAREIMTTWPTRGVPLVVDAEVGPSWGELEKVK